MYKMNQSSYTPENLFAGDYPVAAVTETIKTGAKIGRLAPVVRGAKGIEEVTAETTAKVVGIATETPSGEEVVYYATGEFFAAALNLPAGVTAAALKPAFEAINIYLK